MSLVLGLGLEHSYSWPRECLSSERLSLALASDFFSVLGLGLGFFLCPWPWPRIFFVSLALASDFFLCPWPWPRALCPRLHLCNFARKCQKTTQALLFLIAIEFSFFYDLEFIDFRFFLILFIVAETGVVPKLLLNFEQK